MCCIVCLCLQLASGIYSFACSLWSHHTDCFLQQIYARDEAAALGSLERTLLSLKGIWCIHTHPAFSSLQGNNGLIVIIVCSEMWLNNICVCTSLSVLRKLTVHGFQEPQQNIEVMVSLHSALTTVECAAFLLMLSRVLSQCSNYERPYRLKVP